MLYPKNKSASLSEELFKSPTCEYRGTPFWAWNCKLDSQELARQIDIFKEMGLGGFHMHVRTGLETQYLSDEYMNIVCDCVKKAKDEQMLAWLYDEDRWPSGAAGGYVTKDEKYRARFLLFTPFSYSEKGGEAIANDSRSEASRSGEGRLLACYDVELDSEGYLKSYRVIGEDEQAHGQKWYAYLEIHRPTAWFNNQTYANTLDRATIERFVEVTHERYKQYLERDFGSTVPAIFTDEPQFTRKKLLNNSTDKMDIAMPWTDDIGQSYMKAYGEDIMATLPEIFWDLPQGRVSAARYRYHDHIAERFSGAFADTCGEWCRKNGIALTGHMMEEPTLASQTAALGEAMRSYRAFDIPGIDMLCGNYELTTAKQAQSAVHQYGCEGMLSELYGVTGWDYDFRGHKLQGDWQAALGVTVRVPHLAWVSMAGEAKRDYPASINYQSPWYGEYSYIEDHFARVATALTRGKPMVKVGVVHPVESFWLHWGPNDKSSLARESMEMNFNNVTNWLLRGSVDFDFICESLLPSQCESGSNPLKVGEMEYDTVIVPQCETLRSTTIDRLEQFRKAGGRLIFAGTPPEYENAAPSCRGRELSKSSVCIPFDRASLLKAVECDRTVTLARADGRLTDSLVYQLRSDNDCLWLFAAHCEDPRRKELTNSQDITVTVRGEYSPVNYDTISGEISPLGCKYINGNTVIERKVYDCDSFLIKLNPGRSDTLCENEAELPAEPVRLPERVRYSLSEPNVLLLDMCEFKVDDGEYLPREEILRADNIAREIIGIRHRGGGVAQPWVLPKETPAHTITLKFTVHSEIEADNVSLALEDAEKAEISVNGETVESIVTGYFTDKSIKTLAIPPLHTGDNIIEIKLPLGTRTNTEWCYLLGAFGVRVSGSYAVITSLPEKLAFSNLVCQGLPFYGGCVTYRLKVGTENGRLSICTPQYAGALVKVIVDGSERGKIVCPPYTLVLDNVENGEHIVELKLYLHRYNCFGPVHNADEANSHHGPGAWRTEGDRWKYEYVLRRMGIIASPVIMK